jgi:hypothetical protein
MDELKLDKPSPPARTIPQQVEVVDISMDFWSMVIFMVKAAFAAIPAMFLIAIAWGTLIAALFGG